MYAKQEAARLRQEFWTLFGQYMAPVASSDGEKVSWVNYKTGEKNIQFRMDADGERGVVTIEINHKDLPLQRQYYEQFAKLESIFTEVAGNDWSWQSGATDEWGRSVSRISATLQGVSVFKREDWPQLISFFKKRIMALDEFWSSAKYSFQRLG